MSDKPKRVFLECGRRPEYLEKTPMDNMQHPDKKTEVGTFLLLGHNAIHQPTVLPFVYYV